MQKKLSLTNILAYASTDTAGNLLYCTLTSFILYFYTDVFGISVGAAGTILLVARVIDSLDAPIWGLIIDHTHSKYGQSRPWFLWLAAPFAIFLTLSFLSPDLSTAQKGIYALVTYLITGIIYTGISTPITSILPNLSNDSDERVKLNSYRMVGGNIGYFVTASFTLPLVAFFGGGNDQKGFAITAAVYSVIGLLMFIFAFAKTQEVNSGPQEVQSIPIKDSFKAMRGNWPWVIIVLANVMYWLGNTVRTTTVIYYAQYNLGHLNYASLLNGLVLFQVVGNILIPFMVRKFSKGQTLIIGFSIASLGQILMGFVGSNFALIAAAWIFTSIGTGIAVSMPFAMLSDTVDYGEWKNGIRSAGFLTAIGSAFCIKMGSGLGGFLPSKIMAAAGYVAHKQQTASALAGIKFSFIWLPAICFMIGAAIMLTYSKFEKKEAQIKKDLLERVS
ncbi:MFS transporter [Weissella paramesenteroides]|uniref:MFS transporter n=1 Tax=Weissella paramesenteroides TaxID=1249 RepID=UPI00123BFC3C|nr:MFS transporter [Weissella paramesenteroides]KAA8442063.1 MFS transporter [Weissella paramesenteroides]KAA8442307.1 MFS transporter [Weissella paramesenteroides]KAA8443701.1 MFS transporter [Weissella paramesenteroides]KAA8447202.1 MFS transporter [Weissella paramesenteroides]KAA8450133.1 MFS transporter [Weissella paramesenteroides]